MSFLPQVDMYVPRAEERYRNLLALMRVTHKMERKGWLVDQRALQAHVALAESRVARFTDLFLSITKLPKEALGESGAGQSAAVKKWFWVDQNAPQLMFDKITKRPQFNTELLITYATDFKKEPFGVAAAALYGLRKNKKLLEFCAAYQALSAADGRIHFCFNAAGTQTGRWTSSTKLRIELPDGSRKTYSANAQQVPSKTPEFDFGGGKERLVESLRNVFIADPGCVLLKADYDQLELRLIAYVYGAARLIEWINTGADTHMLNAIGLFKELRLPADAKKVKSPKTDLEKLINAAREAAKPTAYGVSYQMHDEKGAGKYPTLFKQLKKIFPSITEQQANVYAQRFFELHPEIKAGQSEVRKRIQDAGFAELSIDGRRLYYPDTMRGYNQALNFPMQGTGGALANRALLQLDPKLDWAGQEVRAQVHDELVVQAPLASLYDVKGWIEEAMSAPAQIGETYAGIPCEADPGFDWASNVKLKDFVLGALVARYGSPED